MSATSFFGGAFFGGEFFNASTGAQPSPGTEGGGGHGHGKVRKRKEDDYDAEIIEIIRMVMPHIARRRK